MCPSGLGLRGPLGSAPPPQAGLAWERMDRVWTGGRGGFGGCWAGGKVGGLLDEKEMPCHRLFPA